MNDQPAGRSTALPGGCLLLQRQQHQSGSWSRSACSEMMIALLPPSSRSRLFPRRAATASLRLLCLFFFFFFFFFFSIRVEPVAEISATRLSLVINPPVILSPMIRFETPSGMPFALNTPAMMCWHAMAVTEVLSDGFHMHTFPQTQAQSRIPAPYCYRKS